MNDIATVELEDGTLTRLIIRNTWRESLDPEGLAGAITEAILAALQADGEPDGEPLPTTRRELTIAELAEFMAMHNEWLTKARALRRRIDAGEFRPEERPDLVDNYERVFVEFRMGDFDSLHLNPEWAERASLQELADTVLELLYDVPLHRPDPAAEQRRELRDLDRRIREFAS